MTQVLKTSDHLGNLRVNGRIVLKTCLQKWHVRVWTGLGRQCEYCKPTVFFINIISLITVFEWC